MTTEVMRRRDEEIRYEKIKTFGEAQTRAGQLQLLLRARYIEIESQSIHTSTPYQIAHLFSLE